MVKIASRVIAASSFLMPRRRSDLCRDGAADTMLQWRGHITWPPRLRDDIPFAARALRCARLRNRAHGAERPDALAVTIDGNTTEHARALALVRCMRGVKPRIPLSGTRAPTRPENTRAAPWSCILRAQVTAESTTGPWAWPRTRPPASGGCSRRRRGPVARRTGRGGAPPRPRSRPAA